MSDGLAYLMANWQDPGASFGSGFQNGQRDTVLRRFGQNPNDPQSLSALMQVDPQLAFRAQEWQDQVQERQDKRAKRDIYGRLLGGTGGQNEAIAQLAAIDPQEAFRVKKYFSELDEGSRKREGDKWAAAAPLLASLKTVPFEQRSAIAQKALPMLQAAGWTPEELAEVDLSDQSIDAKTRTAMTVAQVLDSQKKVWHPVGENGLFATNSMGDPTGDGNPFAPGPPAPAATPSAPGPGRPPPVGAVVRGKRFKGGNPYDPASWEATGGASQGGSRTFP